MLHYNWLFALNTNLQFMENRVTLLGQQWLKRIISVILKKKKSYVLASMTENLLVFRGSRFDRDCMNIYWHKLIFKFEDLNCKIRQYSFKLFQVKDAGLYRSTRTLMTLEQILLRKIVWRSRNELLTVCTYVRQKSTNRWRLHTNCYMNTSQRLVTTLVQLNCSEENSWQITNTRRGTNTHPSPKTTYKPTCQPLLKRKRHAPADTTCFRERLITCTHSSPIFKVGLTRNSPEYM